MVKGGRGPWRTSKEGLNTALVSVFNRRQQLWDCLQPTIKNKYTIKIIFCIVFMTKLKQSLASDANWDDIKGMGFTTIKLGNKQYQALIPWKKEGKQQESYACTIYCLGPVSRPRCKEGELRQIWVPFSLRRQIGVWGGQGSSNFPSVILERREMHRENSGESLYERKLLTTRERTTEKW